MQRRNRSLFIFFTLLLIARLPFSAALAGSEDGKPKSKPIITGVALTPENFPHHTAKDIDAAFQLAAGIGRLPSLLEDMEIVGLEWALLHDVSLAQFDANLNTVGLITSRGQKKPGFNVFRALKEAFK